MTRRDPTPWRFFLTIQRPSASVAVIALTVVAFAIYLGRIDPGGVDEAVGMTLFLQMFAASTGYRHQLRRGHLDPMLVGHPARVSVACAHWMVSIGPGLATWLALAAVDLALSPRRLPMALTPIGLTAFLFVSTMAWTITLPFARLAGGVLWLIVLAGLGVFHRLPGLVEMFKTGGGSWIADIRQAGAALVCPFLVVGRTTPVAGRVSVLIAAATVSAWAVGLAIINRCDGTLADPT